MLMAWVSLSFRIRYASDPTINKCDWKSRRVVPSGYVYGASRWIISHMWGSPSLSRKSVHEVTFNLQPNKHWGVPVVVNFQYVWHLLRIFLPHHLVLLLMKIKQTNPVFAKVYLIYILSIKLNIFKNSTIIPTTRVITMKH